MKEEIFIPIFLFGSIAAILWKFFDTKHKERMNIIEKGLVKEDLKYLYSGYMWKTNPFSALKYGMLAAFIGVGILLSAFFSQWSFVHEDQITIGIIFLFGGLGLVTFYAISKKKLDEDNDRK